MWIEPQESGHYTWNHWPFEESAPQPQEPEACDVTVADGRLGGMSERPFHNARKQAHTEGLSAPMY